MVPTNRVALLLVVGFVAFAAASSDEWKEDPDWREGSPHVKPKLKEGAESPLFIDRSASASKGVTKLGLDHVKFSNLLQTVHKANGETFTLVNFLADDAKPFVLTAYDVFAENAKLVQQNSDGTESTIPRPKMIHLHGSISGDPSSFVLMHLSSSGSLGLIQTADKKLSIESDPSGHSILVDAAKVGRPGGLQAKEIFAAEQEGAVPDELDPPQKPTQLLNTPAGASLSQSSAGNKYEIGIALDCDQACVARLNQYAPGSGQGTDAASYLTALIAGTGSVYKRDLGRDLKITFMKLWNTASPFDSGTNSLGEYRKAYASNPPSEPYDVAHLMTGIQEGGVAYVGTVCQKSYNVGVSSLRGQWKGSTSGSSAYMWDLEVTAHELGHNLGSGHSHDYSPPIDECVSCKAGMSEAQCKSGGSAVGPVARSDSRCVKGTVMSYCHLCGGMKNIEMKFHTRAIEKIKTVLENNCGPAGPAPAVAGPTPAPVTPAPTPSPPTTVTQTVRLKIETFDETSFKKAIAQLLNEAISQGSINVDSSSGFQVTADDITIVKAEDTSASGTSTMVQADDSSLDSSTDVQYQVKAPAAATEEQVSQLQTTLDSSAESGSLTKAVTQQCNGKCGEVGTASVMSKATTSTTPQQSGSTRRTISLQTLFYTLIVALVGIGLCF